MTESVNPSTKPGQAQCPTNDWTDLLVRGARLARRDEGAHWAFVTEEHRRQAGCPAAKS